MYTGKLTKTATALPIKMKYVFVCIPISMAILMYHAFVMMLDEILAKPNAEKEVKG